MQIVGRGLIARALQPLAHLADDTLMFAGGVGDSNLADADRMQHEIEMLLAAIAQCRREDRRLVYFSSAGRLHQGPETRDESSPLQPDSPYGHHKQACERLLREAPGRYLIVRMANLVGSPQNPQQLVPSWVRQVLRGDVTVFTKATRDLLDVEDLVRWLIAVLPRIPPQETLVIASGVSTPASQLVEWIQEALHATATITAVPRGDTQQFSTARLQAYLPSLAPCEPSYPRHVLHRYAPAIAQQLHDVATSYPV